MHADLVAVVRRQCGAVSRAQLLEHVVSTTLERWLAAGRLVRIYPGVYRAAEVSLSSATRLRAALLYAGAGAHLSHLTAAQVQAIDAGRCGRALHLTVPAGRTVASQPGLVIHRSRSLGGAQVIETRSGLRTTSPARTIIDLVDVLDRPALDVAVADAARAGLVTADYVSRQLDRMPRRRGTRILRQVLGELDPALESVLEAEFANLLAAAGALAPTPQHEIWDGPLLVARVDFAYITARLALEVDGYAYHCGYAAFQRDRTRRRALKTVGWDVVEFTAEDIRSRPAETVATVRRLQTHAAA